MSNATLSNSEFISKIIQDCDVGRSFVPLIGSGLSSPSGIIMGMEFTNYLAFTTYLTLSDPERRERTHGEGKPHHWNLRHQGWPPLPSHSEVKRARGWLLNEFTGICDRYGLDINFDDNASLKSIRSLTPRLYRAASHEAIASLIHPQVPTILASNNLIRPDESVRRVAEMLLRRSAGVTSSASSALDLVLSDSSRSYRERIIELGIRSLHDWRETLGFLASVQVLPTGLHFGSQMNSVIDRFNAFITRDKQPNLGHKMLAHLSGPMRIHTILTTNFDTLIEDAFRSLNLKVRVLPVSSRGSLPEPQTVAAEFAVVKLHGEIHDTRADLTLDDEPAEEDKAAFISYLTRGAGLLGRDSKRSHESKRLLVIGYSGADNRCIQMVKHWLEKGLEVQPSNGRSAPGQILYWVCFSESDVRKVQLLFRASEYRHRIRITQCSHPDVLLYGLYQRLNLSLPPGGLTYEFAQVVPPRRLRAYDHSTEQINNVLACSKTTEHPLEAARVLLAESSSMNDARRLCRDTAVRELKSLILDAVDGKVAFYDQNGQYSPQKLSQCVAAQWAPIYRDDDLYPRDSIYDERHLYSQMGFRPVVIDSHGGVVRGVSEAVADLTAKSLKKVFWLETQDYMDADSMLRDFLRSLAVRCGRFQSQQVTQHPLDCKLTQTSDYKKPNFKELAARIGSHLVRVLADYRQDAQEFVVFLYGRDSYGGCAGLVPSLWGSHQSPASSPAGSENNPLLQRQMRALHCVIEGLALAGIITIYFPLVEKRAKRKNRFPRPIATLKNANRQNESRQQWEISTAPNDSTWKQSQLDRDRFENWRHWPNDKFGQQLTEGSLGKTQFDHSDAKESFVFEGLLEEVLNPYYSFTEQNTRVNTRHAIQRTDQFTRAQERKLVFLYSLTLFRHSRHVNSLCSEGAFQCPSRFNAKAIDNDFIRSQEITRWIDELRLKRVFFDKPGGSVWMHRDVRLTIRYFLENLKIGTIIDDSAEGAKRSIRNQHLINLRSRLHFWIGDWYHKAFCSSGHLTPIIESIHHRIMAALFSPYARYKTNRTSKTPTGSRAYEESVSIDLIHYRALLLESALIEAQKTIHIAWRALKMWQPSQLEESWVSLEHRKKIDIFLQYAIDRILCQVDEWSRRARRITATKSTVEKESINRRLASARNGLSAALAGLSQELLLEGGGSGEKSSPPERCLSPRSSPLNSGLLAFSANREHATTDTTLITTGTSRSISLNHEWSMINQSKSDFEAEIRKTFTNKAITAESLHESIQLIASKVYGKSDIDFAVRGLSREKARWKARFADDPQRLHDMIWLLGEYAYLMLRRAKLVYHASGRVDFPLWIRATVACNLGIDFCKHLPIWLLRFDAFAKVKLHSLYGISLSKIGRFYEAMRHFNLAQALLSKMPDASRSDLAVILLRRAEALIAECTWIRMFIDECTARSESRVNVNPTEPPLPLPMSLGFIDGQKFVLIDSESSEDHWSVSGVQHSLAIPGSFAVPPRIAECLRKSAPSASVSAQESTSNSWATRARVSLARLYKSVLDEAVSLLDQAEHNLSGHSQSSLWWSRLHNLRLMAYGALSPIGDAAADCLLLRKTSPEQGIFESHRSALRIARNDPIRRLRAAKYFLEADRWLRHYEGGNQASTRLPDSYADAIDTLFSLYIDRQVSPSVKELYNTGVCSTEPSGVGLDLNLDYLHQLSVVRVITTMQVDEFFRERWKRRLAVDS
jgi:hypothetical protein